MKKVLLLYSLAALLVLGLCVGGIFLLQESRSRTEETQALSSVDACTADELAALTAVRQESGDSRLRLGYDGQDVPCYDADTADYLFPGKLVDGIAVTVPAGMSLRRCETGDQTTILAFDADSYTLCRVEHSAFSLVCLETADGSSRSEAGSYCYLTVFDQESGEAFRTCADYRVRGSSSRGYDKLNYTIHLRNRQTGKKEKRGVLGLAANTTFSLNSLFEDDSKIRDAFSLSLWESYAPDIGGRKNAVEFVYTELFLNGEYWGVYGFQEIINAASLELSGEEAAVFRVKDYSFPAIADLDGGSSVWGGVKLKYSSLRSRWGRFPDFVELLRTEGDGRLEREAFDYLDLDNSVDYYLLVSLLYATDNEWKNVVLTQQKGPDGAEKLYLTPWDLDLTLGAVWDAAQQWYVAHRAETAVSSNFEQANADFFLTRLWADDTNGFREAAAARWFELRSGVFSTESLLARASGFYDELSACGARQRDAERWPQGGVSQDDSFIETFLVRRTAYLDDVFAPYAP